MVTAQQTREPQVYHSPKAKAQKAIIALTILAVIALISIWSNYQELQLARAIQNGQQVSMEKVQANDTRQTLVTITHYIVFFTTGILFMRWIFTASKNLVPLGIGVQHKAPQLAIVYWIIPIWHLIAPYGVMKEIWAGSHPHGTPGTEDQQAQAPPSPLMLPWWIGWVIFNLFGGLLPKFFADTWIIFTLFGSLLPRSLADTATIEGAIRQNILLLIGDLAALPALVLAMLIVKAITDNQDAKHSTLNPQDPQQGPAPTLRIPDTLSNLPAQPRPQTKPTDSPARRAHNPHEATLANPFLSLLGAKVTRTGLTGNQDQPLSGFSSSANQDDIILSIDFEQDDPAQDPATFLFRFVVIDPLGNSLHDENVPLHADPGTTGYTGIGIFLWNRQRPRPTPGPYSAHIYEAGNKVAETHWTVTP